MNRIDQLLVAGAAAGILVFLEPVADVFAGRIGIGVDQGLGGDNEARGTEAALRAAVDHPGHLQGMQILGGADALDGGDGGTVGNRSILVMQERISLPSMMTLQAPHCPLPQPTLVPVRRRLLRMTSDSRSEPSVTTERSIPLTYNFFLCISYSHKKISETCG